MQQELNVTTTYWPVSGEDLVADHRPPGQWFIATLIWAPAIMVAGILYLAEVPLLAGLAVGLAVLLHTGFNPRIAIYALIVSVQVDWTLSFSAAFSISKTIGLLALVASMPALVREIRRNGWDPSMKWILPFAALPILLVPVSPDPLWALAWVPTMLLIYGLPLLFSVHFRDRDTIRMMIMALIAGALINAVIVLRLGSTAEYLRAGYTRLDWGVEMGAQGEADINELARLMSISVIACIFLFLTMKKILLRWIWVVGGLGLLFAVVLTKARICYIALPFSLVAAPLLLRGGGLARRVGMVLLLVLGAGVAAFLGAELGLWRGGIQERFNSIFREGTSAGGRSLYWLGYWRAFLSSGMLGNGFQMTSVSPTLLKVVGHPMAAHNDVIHILGDLGIIGVILFLGMHIHLFRRIRRMSLPWHKAFALSMQVFMLVGGMTQTDFYRRYYGLGIAVLLLLVRYDERVCDAELEQEQLAGTYEGEYLTDQLSPVGQG